VSRAHTCASAADILEELQALGSAGYKNILIKHGVKEPVYGVKVADLKKIQKRIKDGHRVALDLYATGVYDAMYLAGLLVDDTLMTKALLQRWLDQANCATLREYTVPWVAAHSGHGHALAAKWIESKNEGVASAGWATLSSVVALTEDSALDLAGLRVLLRRIPQCIHTQSDRVRYAMNRFVIAVGTYVKPLSDDALSAAAELGEVKVVMDGTACKVPDAAFQIEKARRNGSIGKKRKTVKC